MLFFSDETLFKRDAFDGFSVAEAAHLSVAGETEHRANRYKPLNVPVRWVNYGVSREHSELDSDFYSPFFIPRSITECLDSSGITITCLFLHFDSKPVTDLFEILPILEKLKCLKLIDLKYDIFNVFEKLSRRTTADACKHSATQPKTLAKSQVNIDKMRKRWTTAEKCQHSISLAKTLTRGYFNVAVAECRRHKTTNRITLDFTRCLNLETLCVVSSMCTVNINSKSLKEIGLVGYDLSQGNIVKALEDSKTLETVRISHCRNILSTFCMSRPRHLYIFGIAETFQSQYVYSYLLRTKCEDFIADAVWFIDTDLQCNTLTCLILCVVELRGEMTKPTSLHEVKIIEEKETIGCNLSMQLCDNLQKIVLLRVELKGYGIVFSNNVERLAFIHVKMSSKSWIKTLETLPAQLEHLVIQNIEINNEMFDLHSVSSSSLLLEKSWQNVFMETLPNFPKSLKTLYISQQMEIGDINVT